MVKMFNRLLFILFLIPIGCAAQIPNHGMYNLLRDVVYECTLTQSVIAAYDFEETTGTTLVDETATHNGTLAASAGSDVMYNIVTDVHGNTAGYTGTSPLGYGIYMDNNIHDVDVTNNFVANTSCALFLHENGIINLSNNVVYDAMLALRISGVVDVNTIQNNTFYLTGRTGTFVWWTNNHQHMIFDVEPSDALDFNDYYSHYEAAPFSYGGSDRDFTTWKSMTGKDANSTFDATGLTVDDTYFVNPTGTTKTFYLNGATNVEDAYGTAITTSFTVPAYSGRIILGNNLNLISE